MAGNGYSKYVSDAYKKDKKITNPRVYKTTGTQYNKSEEKERRGIQSQLANDVAYWQQKRGPVKNERKSVV